MIDYTALAVEIVKPDYAKMTDDQAAVSLNAKTITVAVPISAVDLKRYFLREGILTAALFYAEDAANDIELRKVCRSVYDALFHDVFETLDPQSVQLIGYLDALERAKALTGDQRAAVLALGEESQSFWQTISHRELDHGDLKIARGERWDDYLVKPGGSDHEYDPALVAAKQKAHRDVIEAAVATGDLSVIAVAEKEAQAAAEAVAP